MNGAGMQALVARDALEGMRSMCRAREREGLVSRAAKSGIRELDAGVPHKLAPRLHCTDAPAG